MLKISHLTKIYKGGKKAVDDLSLFVAEGDIYGFIGRNGAGKTSTIKCITGIMDFDSGEITIGGKSIREDPIACKRMIAYIPDSPDLYDSLTGVQYLAFISDIYRVEREERDRQIEKYAAAFELTKDLGDVISAYSHGMKQKLALIAALVHSPRLMVLDEPFVGLDPKASFTLKEIMKEMCAKGCSIFFSTHVLEVAEKLCNKIAIISEGRILKDGAISEVIGDESLEEVFLVKVGLLSSLTVSGSKRKRRLKVGAIGAIALLGGLLFMAFMGMYGYMFSMLMDMAGTPELLLSGGLAIGLLVSLITGLVKIPGVLFAAKDFELLASLPVTDTELFLSKLALAYTFCMTGTGGISLPFAVVYGVKYGASFGFYLAVLLGLLIAPLLVCAVAGLISILISRFASRSRASNLMMLVLSMVMLAAIFIGSMTISAMPDSDIIRAFSGYSTTLAAFPPTGLFASAATGAYFDLFWLLLVCGIPFALFAALSSKVFRRANLSMGERHMKSDFKAKSLSKIGGKSISSALFSRELKSYFSFYGYVMNTAAGPLMALVFTGLMLYGSEAMIAPGTQEDPKLLETVLFPIIVGLVSYCGVISPPTASGISIEGNRLWILRSLPVSAADIFISKLKLPLLIMWPVCIITGVASALVLNLGALNTAIAIILPMVYALFASLAGLICNLLLPMLNWKNPMVPIKRSGSVFLCMLVGFVAIGIPVAVLLLTGVNFSAFAIALAVVLLVVCAFMWRWLKTSGSKRFYAI